MSALLDDSIILWAAALIVVLPILIVAAGEYQERLRQRGSAFERPVATIRNWVLPLVVLWVLIVVVFDVDEATFVPQVIATGALIALVVAALQLLGYVADAAHRRAQLPGAHGVPQLLLMLPRLIVFILAGWFLFGSIWNVDLTGLFAALGVTSLVISLALQPTLSSIASGLLLLGDRPFQPGDWIRFGDTEGRVVDVNWRSSRIRDRNGDLVVVPNAELAESTVINFAEPSRLHRVIVPVQVAYSNPPTTAKDMLLAAARATDGVVDDPPPSVLVKQIDDPLMGYEVHLWIDDFADAPRVFSDFGSLVWYHSNRMDVPLPSPAYDLYHHDPIQEAADAEVSPADLRRRLERAPILATLSDADLVQLAGSARAVRFSRGEQILRGGIVDRDTYVMWEGRARVINLDDPSLFVDLSDGDIFGVLSRSSRRHEPPSVIAVTDCEIVVIDAEAAGAVASRNPSVTDAINQLAANRMRRLEPPAELPVPALGAGSDEGTDPAPTDEAP